MACFFCLWAAFDPARVEQPVFLAATPVNGWRRLEAPVPGSPAAAQDRVWVADVGDLIARIQALANRPAPTKPPQRAKDASATRFIPAVAQESGRDELRAPRPLFPSRCRPFLLTPKLELHPSGRSTLGST